jgi:hypothetical protein
MVSMKGRVYAPSGSFFLSPDPFIPDSTDTRSYNRYSYARFNPLTYVDPTGFTDEQCSGAVERCPGKGADAMPWERDWSCYGNCGSGYANSFGTVTTAGGDEIPWVGDPGQALTEAWGIQAAYAAVAPAMNAAGQDLLNSIFGPLSQGGVPAEGGRRHRGTSQRKETWQTSRLPGTLQTTTA